MAKDVYYSKDAITKRLRSRLRPEPVSVFNKFRRFFTPGKTATKLPPLKRSVNAGPN